MTSPLVAALLPFAEAAAWFDGDGWEPGLDNQKTASDARGLYTYYSPNGELHRTTVNVGHLRAAREALRTAPAPVTAADLWPIYARGIGRSADWKDAENWERKMLEEMAAFINARGGQ
jgi:hypothetical protein